VPKDTVYFACRRTRFLYLAERTDADTRPAELIPQVFIRAEGHGFYFTCRRTRFLYLAGRADANTRPSGTNPSGLTFPAGASEVFARMRFGD